MKKYAIFAAVIIAFLTACQTKTSANKNRAVIMSSNEIIHDMIKSIGGDFIEARSATRPGSDPHLYKATEKDLISITDSSLIIYNGSHLERRLEWAIGKIGNITPAISITGYIPEDKLIRREKSRKTNPHFWHDASLWRQTASFIADNLTEMNPVNEPVYRRNEEIYIYKLNELDKYIREKTAGIPKNKRFIVTEHDAFAYFGKAYGFQTLSLQGIDTSEEISSADINRFADIIAEKNIHTVFTEASFPDRNIRLLQSILKSRGYFVKIGGVLYSDTLIAGGSYEDTMRYNIDTIANALEDGNND